MTTDLNSINDAEVVFSTEINDLTFTPDQSGYVDFTIQNYTMAGINNGSDRVFNTSVLRAEKGRTMHITGFGDIIRDLLMANIALFKSPSDVFYIGVQYDDGRVVRKGLNVIAHFGSPWLKAATYVTANFLNDCKIGILPGKSEGMYLPKVYLYDKELSDHRFIALGYNGKGAGSSQTITGSSFIKYGNIQSYYASLRRPARYYMICPEDQTHINIQFMIAEEATGKGFLFRNSFGLMEYVFIQGVLSKSHKKESTEVIAGAAAREVDVSTDDTFSLKCESAPDWLVDNARSLLSSSLVFMLDDPCDYTTDSIILQKSNVIVKELSGNISEDPEKLSEFTLTFKRNDI